MPKIKIIKYILFLLIFKNSYSNIYINSIPKCGTHLLVKCVELLTNKKGLGISTETFLQKGIPDLELNQFLYCHLKYSQHIYDNFNNKNYKLLFIFRDPRDQIVSHVNWIKEEPRRALGNPDLPINDTDALINFFIDHIANIYALYLPWTDLKNVCTIKFEDLVGPQGKGEFKKQKSVVEKIAKFLNVHTPNNVRNCVKNLFGGTATFRKGEISNWRKYFKPYHIQKMKKISGDLLIKLGYEKDYNW